MKKLLTGFIIAAALALGGCKMISQASAQEECRDPAPVVALAVARGWSVPAIYSAEDTKKIVAAWNRIPPESNITADAVGVSLHPTGQAVLIFYRNNLMCEVIQQDADVITKFVQDALNGS